MRRSFVAAVVLALSACGGRIAAEDAPIADAPSDASVPQPDARDASPAPDAAVCVDAVGAEVTLHACVHGEEGPFETLVLADTAQAARDASRLHVAYRLAAVEGARSGYVTYVPVRSGEHVLYTSRARVVALERRGEGPLPVVHRQPVSDCPSFEEAAVFDLEAGRTYEVAFAPSGGTGLVFFEHMGSFETPWQSRCRERDR